MAKRRVKCQDTGDYSTSDVAFQASNGKYWSSETAYQTWQQNKEWRQKCIDKLFELLGYQKGFTVPSNLFNKLHEYEVMGYDVVYETIEQQTDSINWALTNKDFKTEGTKIIYICRILENHMIDVYKKHEIEKRKEKMFKEIDIPNDTNVSNRKQGGHDISKFLED